MMDPNTGIDLKQLLASPVTTLFLASLAVKLLISTFKVLTPAIGTPSTATPFGLRWAAMALGVAAAFIMGVGLFAPLPDLPWYLAALNKVLGGFLVGGGALGVHESQQILVPKA